MSQARIVVDELKRILRENGYSYRDVAARLDLSEASVKRLFSQADFSLERLEKVLAMAGLDFSDLMDRVNSRREFLSELTPEQEEALVGDPDFFVITFLVLNRWRIEEIVEEYDFTPQVVEKVLLRLNRLKLIELLPLNRYRLLTSRNFTWRRHGSVSRFFRRTVLPEFFDSQFRDPGEDLRFLGGMLSADSALEMNDGIRRLARQFAELTEQDSRLPLSRKAGCSAVLGFRPIEYSIFRERRRPDRPPRRLDLGSD